MKYRLEELVDLQIGRTPPRKEFEWFNTNGEGYKWVSIKDMGNSGRFISDTSEYLTEAAQKRFGIPIVEKGTLLLSFKLTVGRLCITTDRMLTNEAIAQLPIKDANIVDRDFLYYYLKNYNFHQLGSTSSIATAINSTYLKKMEIDLPPIDQQRAIAAVLSSIDDKIESNNAINNNLMQQALCIYGSLIDGKSKNGCVGDYCSLKSGFAFKSEWWQDSGVPVIKIGSINQDCLNLKDCSYVSKDKIPLAKDFTVSGGDLLIAMTGATIGKFTMVPKTTETILVNQRVGKFFLGDNPISRIPFIYSTLKQQEIISEIINRGQGSAQPNISAADIMSIPCVIPSQTEISAFNEQTTPIFEMIIGNQYENTLLSNTRDSLLPKLLSGELDISTVEF